MCVFGRKERAGETAVLVGETMSMNQRRGQMCSEVRVHLRCAVGVGGEAMPDGRARCTLRIRKATVHHLVAHGARAPSAPKTMSALTVTMSCASTALSVTLLEERWKRQVAVSGPHPHSGDEWSNDVQELLRFGKAVGGSSSPRDTE